MKRRSRAGGGPIKRRRRRAPDPKRRDAPKAAAPSTSSTPGREAEVARLTRELDEALERQAATSEILQVVSGSPDDLQPVFAAMLENAVRICDAEFGNIYRWDGEALHLLAAHNTPPSFAEERRRLPLRPDPKTAVGQMVTTKTVVHVSDITAEEGYKERREPMAVAAVALGGIRTLLGVPLLNMGEMIGAFFLSRQEVRLFTDKQIALVTSFAAQAVIAIENARLLNELRQRTTDLTERTADLTEALEQQTATSEVLRVISSSPGDLQPVFATMLENAVRICDATFGNIFRWNGDAFHLVATHKTPPAFAEARGLSPLHPNPTSHFGHLVATKSVVHTPDLAAEKQYVEERRPAYVEAVELGGIRTFLAVPMLKDDELIGAFGLFRQEVRPFADTQIELVKNFAAQAVIAIENARLLNELRQRTDDLTKRTTDLSRNAHQWRRVRYSYMDCRRQARKRGLVILGTRKIWDSSLAAIGMLWAKRQGKRHFRAYHDRVFERFWRRELDIEDAEAIASILSEVNADRTGFLRYLAGAGRIEHDTIRRSAESAGVFGVPSFIVEGDLFWGREHLADIREKLAPLARNIPARVGPSC